MPYVDSRTPPDMPPSLPEGEGFLRVFGSPQSPPTRPPAAKDNVAQLIEEGVKAFFVAMAAVFLLDAFFRRK